MEALLEQLQPVSNQQLETSPEVISKPNGSRAFSPKSLANLKQPFPKGVSGNPLGRPKGFAELRNGILEHYSQNKQRALKRLFVERIDLYFAYAFGKPADRVELSGPDGGAIEVQQSSQVQLVAQMVERGLKLPGME